MGSEGRNRKQVVQRSQDLGWNQKYLLEDTLKDLIDYWKFKAFPIVKS